MTAANNSPKPTEEMWNAPVMMEFKHNTGLGESIGAITEDAPIGSKTITASLTGVSAGSWVCLVLGTPKLGNTDNDVINSELSPYQWQDIKVQQGITPNIKQMVFKYSNTIRIEKISGNSITLKNPSCMLLIKIGDGMYIKFANYANVGRRRTLQFKGHAKEKFIHQALT